MVDDDSDKLKAMGSKEDKKGITTKYTRVQAWGLREGSVTRGGDSIHFFK